MLQIMCPAMTSFKSQLLDIHQHIPEDICQANRCSLPPENCGKSWKVWAPRQTSRVSIFRDLR